MITNLIELKLLQVFILLYQVRCFKIYFISTEVRTLFILLTQLTSSFSITAGVRNRRSIAKE